MREGGLRFQARDGRFALPLDEERARLLRAYVGQPVTLGIRPEDLHVAGSRYVTGPVAEAAFPVEVLEPMGNEIFVYARAGEQTLVARVPPQPLPGPGEPVRLAFDLARLHFFDAETEEAIGFQVAVAA
ncbi:MAG: hypothetical protein KatS3mg044_1201 [Rhodothermaceae bacterium]|nr:MAG: hypothetical protein KatS3mg044_1201 [Rhodothermaceae bacterium]